MLYKSIENININKNIQEVIPFIPQTYPVLLRASLAWEYAQK